MRRNVIMLLACAVIILLYTNAKANSNVNKALDCRVYFIAGKDGACLKAGKDGFVSIVLINRSSQNLFIPFF